MKKFVFSILIILFLFPLFAEVHVQSQVYFTDIWNSQILIPSLNVEFKGKNAGFNVCGNYNYLQDFDVQDITDFTCNFDSFTIADCALAFFYQTENLKISPYLCAYKFNSSDGNISIFSGKIEVPWTGAYGIKISLFNNFLDVFYTSSNVFFKLQNGDSYSDFINLSQNLFGACYNNVFSINRFSFNTVLSYNYLWGSFNGETENFKSSYEKITAEGQDSVHLVSLGEQFLFKYDVLELCAGIRDFFIADESVIGSYFYRIKILVFKLFQPITYRYLENSDTFNFDGLSLWNLLVVNLGCNLKVHNKADFKFHFGKQFYIPFTFKRGSSDSTVDSKRESIDKTKLLLSGFNIELSIRY